MNRRVLLVRHPAVDARFAGVCYGASDAPLGPDGLAAADELAILLAREPVTHLYHSGLSRTAAVAERLAALTGVDAVSDTRLRERSFGEWELRTWDEIHADTGDAMMGTVSDPAGWRPPGGETTFELRDRVLAWYAELPPSGVIVAVTHGGPIAALRGVLAKAPVTEWPELVPRPGGIVTAGPDDCRNAGSKAPR